jgi:hypothetical protein
MSVSYSVPARWRHYKKNNFFLQVSGTWPEFLNTLLYVPMIFSLELASSSCLLNTPETHAPDVHNTTWYFHF